MHIFHHHVVYLYLCTLWSRDSLVVKRRTRDRKVASSNPGRSGGNFFFYRVDFVCRVLFGVLSSPVLPQWHVKTTVILPKVQVAG